MSVGPEVVYHTITATWVISMQNLPLSAQSFRPTAS